MDPKGERNQKYSRGLQHDTAHTGHGAQTICCVLDGQGFILKYEQKINKIKKLSLEETLSLSM